MGMAHLWASLHHRCQLEPRNVRQLSQSHFSTLLALQRSEQRGEELRYGNTSPP